MYLFFAAGYTLSVYLWLHISLAIKYLCISSQMQIISKYSRYF